MTKEEDCVRCKNYDENDDSCDIWFHFINQGLRDDWCPDFEEEQKGRQK